MKTLIVLILLAIGIGGYSQGLLSPVSPNLFADKALGKTTAWIPRLSVGLNAVSYGKNPETKFL